MTFAALENAYYTNQAPLNAVEGFIRQILGWREYIRGIYWLKMPKYSNLNFLDAKRDLPDFYWTGKTEMACVSSVVTQTKVESYAHHIQRLMITGNFALLSGVSPQEVHEWYLAVYADAFEWVELPNPEEEELRSVSQYDARDDNISSKKRRRSPPGKNSRVK